MKNWIVKSNKWYDNMPEPRRTIFFILVIMGSLIVTQYVTYALKFYFAFPIWAVVIGAWRMSYVFINWREDYKKMNKTFHEATDDVKDNVDVFERSKNALRKHIEENPEQVKEDLEELRKKSTGENTVEDYFSQFGINVTTDQKCDHHFINAGTLQGVAMKRCIKCNHYIKDTDE